MLHLFFTEGIGKLLLVLVISEVICIEANAIMNLLPGYFAVLWVC